MSDDDFLLYFKGSKKHINKALKNVLKLYSSFPSEVISILLEFLLKAQESAAVAELQTSSQVCNSGASYNTQLDDWKPLIMKLSNKEPEMLLSLLKAVVQMIETREGSNQESGKYIQFRCMTLCFTRYSIICIDLILVEFQRV